MVRIDQGRLKKRESVNTQQMREETEKLKITDKTAWIENNTEKI